MLVFTKDTDKNVYSSQNREKTVFITSEMVSYSQVKISRNLKEKNKLLFVSLQINVTDLTLSEKKPDIKVYIFFYSMYMKYKEKKN